MITFKQFISEEAPANNTAAAPGAGSDNTLHMKKMRLWKTIHRRHKLKYEKKGDISAWSKSKYYLQPDGSYVKGGDGRSEGLTRKQLEDMGKAHKIQELSTGLLNRYKTAAGHSNAEMSLKKSRGMLDKKQVKKLNKRRDGIRLAMKKSN